MRIITDDPDRVCDFITSITKDFGWRDYTAIGLERGGQLVAGVVYDGFNGVNICLHIASVGGRRSLNKEFLSYIFYYPFETCKVKRITGLIPESNKNAVEFAENLKGAKLEARLKDAAPNGDMLVYRMFKEDCTYIRKDYGREKQFTTSRNTT